VNPANSEAVLRRLSHYARCLRKAIVKGTEVVTSEYIAQPCGTTSASVRKDLSIFGEFGKRGSGYDVRELLKAIEDVLGITQPPSLVLMGAGRLGRMLASGGVPGGVYEVAAVFDSDPARTGERVGDLTVAHTDDMPGELPGLEGCIGVIAVTPGCAQEAADRLIEHGCRTILCMNMEPVEVPEDVILRRTEMPTELDLLSHDLRKA
jgi:redox-sensing transcriptional repressor